MKITMIFSLMSAFHSSIHSGVWQPEGSPAIYKLIEKLDASEHQLTIYFTAKSPVKTLLKNKTIHLRGLNTPLQLLKGPKASAWFQGIRGYLNELSQIVQLFKAIRKNKPDVVYVDRSNILIAAIVATFTKIPVVVRLLGVTPMMRQWWQVNAISHWIYRLAYRAAFALVIATMDGSPVNRWIEKALNKKTPYLVLLNGVDYQAPSTPIVATSKKIEMMYVNRLEPIKGAKEFIETLLSLPHEIQQQIHVTIIGDGSLAHDLKNEIQKRQADSWVTFTGNVPHQAIGSYLTAADIYISTNFQGNLSNANLEAMRQGLCIIMPDLDLQTGRDVDTYHLIPKDAVSQFAMENMIVSLGAAIIDLVNHPHKREQHRQAMLALSGRFKSWDERLLLEQNILGQVLFRETLDASQS